MATKRPRALTEKEMLNRVPDKTLLNTREVRHALGDVHEVTVYKWVAAGDLPAHRVKARGRANVYKREEVVKFIKGRFLTHPRVEDQDD